MEARGRIREPRVAPESASRSHSSPEPSTLSTPTPACSLGANPFPEVTDLFCRLPLPTLFCRPEAFSLGDRLRLTVRTGARERDLPRIFQARPQDTLLHERSAAFQDSKPCPSMKLFKGQPILQKETTASSGACGHGPRIVTALPLHFPAARLRNVHAFPFGKPVETTEVVAISFEASNYTLP